MILKIATIIYLYEAEDNNNNLHPSEAGTYVLSLSSPMRTRWNNMRKETNNNLIGGMPNY
jgi:hypothetical protein